MDGVRVLLNEATATGASTGIHLARPLSLHTLDIFFVDPTTNISALTVTLEGALDGRDVSDADAHWHVLTTKALAGGELQNPSAGFGRAVATVTDVIVTRIRANITVLTGGGGAGDAVTVRHIGGGL